jgi:hypothetical protein
MKRPADLIGHVGQFDATTGNELAKGREGTTFTGKEDGTGHGVVLENYLIIIKRKKNSN